MSTSQNVADEAEVAKFVVNSYYIFYRTKRHMLDSGIRLLETNAAYGDDTGLINSFRQLLTFDIHEKMLINVKLTPLDATGRFYSKDFETLILNLNVGHLQMFLIHYPAAPLNYAVNNYNMPIHTETWLAVSNVTQNDLKKINAVGAYNYGIKHLIHLTEVVVVGPMVKNMRWYTCYTYSSGTTKSNVELSENPLVKSMSMHYKIAPSHLLMLWALQRGESIIPRVHNSRFEMEQVTLSARISPYDLSLLDVAVMQSSNDLLHGASTSKQ